MPSETAAGFHATLTSDERDRSARLRFERDRRRFVVARGVLRALLGRYLGIRPGHVRFAHNAFGKPELSAACGSELKFNLSHSADLALIAIAPRADVGIDLEQIRERPDYAEIARHFFPAAEAAHVNALPRHLHAEAFLSSWTKKEAYVKACGRSLADLDHGSPYAGPDRRWSLYTLRPAPGYVGALAVEGRAWRVRQWHWHTSQAATA